MKKTVYFLYYWLPPIVWMAFIFPTNRSLTHDSTSRFLLPLLTWLFPHADSITIELAHIAIRKSVHFFEYGLLAFLLLRAFRERSRAWKLEWILYSGIISLAYAALDESIQAFLPLRTGQFSDWMINAAGVFCTLGVISLKFRMVAGVKEPG